MLTSGIASTGVTDLLDIIAPPAKNAREGSGGDFAFLFSRTIDSLDSRPTVEPAGRDGPGSGSQVRRQDAAQVTEKGETKPVSERETAERAETDRLKRSQRNGERNVERTGAPEKAGDDPSSCANSKSSPEGKRVDSAASAKRRDKNGADERMAVKYGDKSAKNGDSPLSGLMGSQSEGPRAPHTALSQGREDTVISRSVQNDRNLKTSPGANDLKELDRLLERFVKSDFQNNQRSGSDQAGRIVRLAGNTPAFRQSVLAGGASGSGANSVSTSDQKGERGKETGVKITVTDLRGKRAHGAAHSAAGNDRLSASEPKTDSKLFGKNDSAQGGSPKDAQALVMELGGRPGDRGQKSENVSLSRNFRERFESATKSEIVKQTGIILKNERSGEIRLVLKPDNLGNVRIRLSLNDNRIVGRILVENNIVRELFEENLENLTKALADQGYETGQFSVTVGGGGEGSRGEREESRPAAHLVRQMEDNVPLMVEQGLEETLVNLMV